MSLSTMLRDAEDRCKASASQLRRILGDEATASFLKTAATVDRTHHYKYFPPAFQDAVSVLAAKHGSTAARQALAASLWTAMVDVLQSGRYESLPRRVRWHQGIQIRRILQAEYDSTDWLSLDSDLFHKDFGLASLRLYAAAAQVIDPCCGVPRSVIFRAGFAGDFSVLPAMLDIGGFSPLLQIHTHLRYLDEFNPEGWNECYRTCGDIYSMHPELRGVYGGSWFYDPLVSSISQRLAYLREVPQAGGAHIVFGAAKGDFVQDAISTSPSRRKLYESGEYKPRSFFMVWGRRRQLDWIQKNPSALPDGQ